MTGGRGYYRMARGWMEHPAFGREPFTRAQAWIWLIERAAWRDTTQPVGRHFVQVQRGQVAVAVRYLAEAWQWSKSSVDRFLTRLETGTMIGTQPGTQYTVITICNYEKYQGDWDTSGTQDGTAPGTRAGHERDKEEEDNKINKTLMSDRPADLFSLAEGGSKPQTADDAAFDAFWSAYPRKVGKPEARKSWKAALKKADAGKIIDAASAYAEQTRGEKTEPRFIKHPSAWLNAERWADFQPSLQADDDFDRDFDRAFAAAQAAGPEVLRDFINRHRPAAE
jgi:hypothetical protein